MEFRSELVDDVKEVRFFGFFIIALGIVALICPFAAGVSTAVVLSLLVVLAGSSFLALAWITGGIPGRGKIIAIGMVTLICGLFMLFNPGSTLGALTILFLVYFFLVGVLEVAGALVIRPEDGWIWMLCSGLISVVLAILIVLQFSTVALWLIGIFIGVRLLTNGAMLLLMTKFFKSELDGPG